MTKRLTTEALEAIRKRAEAATEGPWEIEESRYEAHWNVGHPADFFSASLCPENDAEFIAHSREDIPALLAEVVRLREAVVVITEGMYVVKYEMCCGERRAYIATESLQELIEIGVSEAERL